MINPVVEIDLLNTLRELSQQHGCRLDISSDASGALGGFACCASNSDRSVQGFGSTLSAAIDHYRRGGVGRAKMKTENR